MTLRDKIAKIIHVELLKQSQGLGQWCPPVVDAQMDMRDGGAFVMVDGVVNLSEIARKVEGLIDV